MSPPTNVHLRPEQVAELAADEQEAAERERVGRHDPLAAVGREAQIGLRRRQRDVHDRRVEHDHELRRAKQAEDGPAVVRGRMGIGRRHHVDASAYLALQSGGS